MLVDCASTNTLTCTKQQTNKISDSQLELFLIKLYHLVKADKNCNHILEEALQNSEL
jgi:hypothetical protein